MMPAIHPRRPDDDPPVRVPITFPDDLYEWLRAAAFKRHVSMAEIVREAVREYRQRHDPQMPLPLPEDEVER
jgi:hypothetical protein